MPFYRKILNVLRFNKKLLANWCFLIKKGYFRHLFDYAEQMKKIKLSPQEYINYKFNANSEEFKNTFLPYDKAEEYWVILNPAKNASLARDKYITHCLLDSLNIPKAKLLFTYSPESGESICDNDGTVIDRTDKIIEILSGLKVDHFIMKPAADSAHGNGVQICRTDNYKMESSVVGNRMILFEEVIKQNEQMSSFNSSSVNTIRMMTALYPDGEVKLFAAFLKIGRAGSAIDNAGAGGNVDCGIDVKTGQLYNAVRFDSFENVVPIDKHPDSGTQINGVIIENWNQIVDLIKSYQARIPWLKTIGWDVAVTDKGPIIVEINNWWDTTGQLFIGKGWHEDVKDCFDAWVKHYNSVS